MSDLFTTTIEAGLQNAQLAADLAKTQAALCEVNALWAADRRRIADEHPVVEAAVAAVEAHFADARLRELALAVKRFQAARTVRGNGSGPADNADTRQL